MCCAQGLKISLGMHNFGEKRWQSRVIDDLRSQTDQNTRIIGELASVILLLYNVGQAFTHLFNCRCCSPPSNDRRLYENGTIRASNEEDAEVHDGQERQELADALQLTSR